MHEVKAALYCSSLEVSFFSPLSVLALMTGIFSSLPPATTTAAASTAATAAGRHALTARTAAIAEITRRAAAPLHAGESAAALPAAGSIATKLSLLLARPAFSEVLPALVRTATVGLPGLRSFTPASPVILLRSPLISVRDS